MQQWGLSMCPKRYYQQGYLLPLALLVLLSMGTIAAFMVRQINASATMNLLDGASAQANYAAVSGQQLALHRLLLGRAGRRDIDRSCLNLSMNQGFTSSGLNQCQVVVSCHCVYENATACDPEIEANYDSNPSTMHSIYELVSEASCGSGEYLARRQQRTQVHASSLNEPENLASYRGHDWVISDR